MSKSECIHFINSAPLAKIGGAEASAKLWVEGFRKKGYTVSLSTPKDSNLVDLRREIVGSNPEAIIVGDINHWTLRVIQTLLELGVADKICVLANRDPVPMYAKISLKRLLSDWWLLGKAKNIVGGNNLQVLAISNWIADRMVRLGISKIKPPVYTPVSNHDVNECELSTIRDDQFKVISVGRIVPEKGFLEYLVPLALACKADNLPVQFCLVGPDDDKSYFAQIQAQAQNAIELKGPKSSVEICREYNQSHLLAHLVATEGFGLVLLEAAIHALPILATEIPASQEFFGKSNQPIGRLVDCQNIDAMVAQSMEFVHECIANRDQWQIMSNNARNLATSFDRHKAIDKFISLVLRSTIE